MTTQGTSVLVERAWTPLAYVARLIQSSRTDVSRATHSCVHASRTFPQHALPWRNVRTLLRSQTPAREREKPQPPNGRVQPYLCAASLPFVGDHQHQQGLAPQHAAISCTPTRPHRTCVRSARCQLLLTSDPERAVTRRRVAMKTAFMS
jgi:hypothetical protein